MSDLQKFYDQVYSGDKNAHFLKYRGGRTVSSAHAWVLARLTADVAPASLLDFGCGEADFLGVLPATMRRTGVDYSAVACATARSRYPTVEICEGTEVGLVDRRGEYDIVTSFGVLEHVDVPADVMRQLSAWARPGGEVIVSCPSFLNVRGIIWMTLVSLFEVPMSLSDRHFVTPALMRQYAEGLPLTLTQMVSVDHEVASGVDFRGDMLKRLTNALRDARLDNTRVEQLIAWVEANRDELPAGDLAGAEMIYVFRRDGGHDREL